MKLLCQVPTKRWMTESWLNWGKFNKRTNPESMTRIKGTERKHITQEGTRSIEKSLSLSDLKEQEETGLPEPGGGWIVEGCCSVWAVATGGCCIHRLTVGGLQEAGRGLQLASPRPFVVSQWYFLLAKSNWRPSSYSLASAFCISQGSASWLESKTGVRGGLMGSTREWLN